MSRAAKAAFLAAVVAGALLRFHDIGIRPLHHDEGVNCLFLFDLIQSFKYRYDPENYHGPLLYFMVGPLLKVLGQETLWLRFWPAAIGTATLFLFYALRRQLGEWGAVAGAWLTALSPIAVYFNRDLIHETWFVASAALIAGVAAAYHHDRRPAWIVLAWIGFAAMIATKETAPILLFALAGGALAASVLIAGWGALPALLAELRATRRTQLWGLIVATAILVVLFTSFFTNPKGCLDMFRAYFFWTKTGTHGAGHEKPWPYFFDIAWRYERAAWVLGVLGMLVALVRREAAAGIVLVGVILFGVHAAIPYKTPWLVIGFLPWLAAGAGYLVDRASAALPRGPLRVLPMLALAVLLVLQAREAWRLSFVDYDDDRESIVYSQTRRGFRDLVDAVRAVAVSSPDGLDLTVDVLSSDHFPLNWYTRDMERVAYWGGLRVNTPLAPEGVSIVSRHDFDKVRQGLESTFRARTFDLRPGVELTVMIPESLFELARPRLSEPGRWTQEGPLEPLPAIPEAEMPSTLRAGLLAKGYAGARIGETPAWSQQSRPVVVDYDHGRNPEWSEPFAIEWKGYLKVPVEGMYRFVLESDDGSMLVIDGNTVVDNWGQHPLERREGAAWLATGYHHVAVQYQDFGGGAKLFFKWRIPGNENAAPHLRESYVLNDVLFHDTRLAGVVPEAP